MRNKIYAEFLATCDTRNATVHDIIKLGAKLMRKHKVHHHFFGDCTLWATAEHLTYHALQEQRNIAAKITVPEATAILELFERRIASRLPVEYITNTAQYLDYTYYVNENVLVPRSIMNTRFKDFLAAISWDQRRVLDLCAGSGCVGITLALLDAQLQVDLADISPQALDVARVNIARHAVGDRVKCVHSDLFANVQATYDLIITNPPYVSVQEYKRCPEEFKQEPKIALESGSDGLDIIHRILTQAKNYLNPNGVLIAEVGFTAAKRVKQRYPRVKFKWFKYRRPNGRESMFGMHGVLWCARADLPGVGY